MDPPLQTVLMLFRKDLRLDDNPALLAALQAAKSVVPVFIWAPEEEGQFQPGRCSRWWLKQTLLSLSQQTAALGSRLIVRTAQCSGDMLLQLVQETQAQAVFFNHLFDPISLVRDHTMKQQLTEAGVVCRSYTADLLYDPWEVLDSQGRPLNTFADFWSQLQAMPQQPPLPFPAPAALPAVDLQLPSESGLGFFFANREQEQASQQLASKWNPGFEGGLARLEEFLSGQLPVFSHHKANVDRSVTSRLSPWIHSGSLSVRFVYHRVRAKQSEWLAAGSDHSSSCQDFIQQLAYREYSRYLSFHFPFIHERPLLSHLRCVPWNLDQQAFKAWKMGMTGYPLIDAAMKQLWSEGWCHNRLRVACGVFAVKHLLLPWQWGLKHYWDSLLDADLESDALGWQYVAGCMIDAPLFGEAMDFESEAASFDPDGEYVRRWLPVLARMPTAYVHAPWTAPAEVLDAADVELGFNYPYPIVTQEVAAARLANAAAIIQENLQQISTKQCTSPDKQQQASGAAVGREPYRPATEPTQSYSRGMDAAAAAAAADMQQRSSMLQLEHVHGTSGAAAAAGAAAAGAGEAAAAARQSQPHGANREGIEAAEPAAAAAVPGAAPNPGALQGNEWQLLAQQHDVHRRQRRQQRQQQQQQWQQQHGRHKARHQHMQQHGRYQRHDEGAGGYEDEVEGFSDSECSEVNSNAPVVSEVMPTACSRVVQQRQRRQQLQEQQEQEQQQQQQQQGEEEGREVGVRLAAVGCRPWRQQHQQAAPQDMLVGQQPQQDGQQQQEGVGEKVEAGPAGWRPWSQQQMRGPHETLQLQQQQQQPG